MSRKPTPMSATTARARQRGAAVFHGPRANGEPQWLDPRRGDDPCFGPCRGKTHRGLHGIAEEALRAYAAVFPMQTETTSADPPILDT